MLPLLFACTASPVDTAESFDTAAETDTADDTAADTATDPFEPAEGCPAPEAGRQAVESVVAGEYFVMHPLEDTFNNPVVLLLPGGGGDERSASAGWDAFFDEDPRGYRIVAPWVNSDDYPDVPPPVEALLDEMAACFGPPSAVHLLGHSNGGYLAYNVTGPELAERFASITGAPAYFQRIQKSKLEGLPFHNMAGENDDWLQYTEEAHAELQAEGFESELTVWAGEGHTPSPAWADREAMFDFWDRHAD